MNIQEINSFIAPIGLIIAGIILKSLKGRSPKYQSAYKKLWLFFILMGVFLLVSKLYQ